jgi:hypothetical protein
MMVTALAVPMVAQAEGFHDRGGCGNAFRTCAAGEVNNESRGLSFRISSSLDRPTFTGGKNEIHLAIRDESPGFVEGSTILPGQIPCPAVGGAPRYPGDCPATVTPEPATMMLLATGLLGMSGMGFARRKKRSEVV